ncbi:MAG TPA: hypothetical protein VJ746_14235 [Nitrospira sp.]|nr:hypothetical protein [Nitrospira sp.]
MTRRLFVFLPSVIALVLTLSAAASFSAEEPGLDLNASDIVRHALEQQLGKRVKIKLFSGQDLDGKVQKVGAQAVSLAELGGMDFFDATVRLDQVAAVFVKVRGK